jgi:hypothetical protein
VAEKCSDTISIYVASSSLRQSGEDQGQKTKMKTRETNTKDQEEGQTPRTEKTTMKTRETNTKDQEEGQTPKMKTRTNTKDIEQMTKNKVKVNDKHQKT